MEKENSPHGRAAAGDATVREGRARRGRGAPVLLERSNTLVGQDRRDTFWKRKGELV